MTNPTMAKFGYPGTLLREFEHWVILLRSTQVTLASLVLAAKSEATAYAALPDAAFAEQGAAVRLIERALAAFVAYEKVNYLMLMMVDPNVHFHVIPRYSEPRSWNGIAFPDSGWPGPPDLRAAVALDARQVESFVSALKPSFY